jgi:hypothetical protein
MRQGFSPLKVISHEQVTSISSAKALTVPNGCVAAMIQAEGAAVRVRFDNTAPTTAVGLRLLVTEGPLMLPFPPHGAQVIEETGTAKVNVIYFRE